MNKYSVLFKVRISSPNRGIERLHRRINQIHRLSDTGSGGCNPCGCCSCPPQTVSCFGCPPNFPITWTVVMSGLTSGTQCQNCEAWNGTHTLTLSQDAFGFCIWTELITGLNQCGIGPPDVTCGMELAIYQLIGGIYDGQTTLTFFPFGCDNNYNYPVYILLPIGGGAVPCDPCSIVLTKYNPFPPDCCDGCPDTIQIFQDFCA